MDVKIRKHIKDFVIIPNSRRYRSIQGKKSIIDSFFNRVHFIWILFEDTSEQLAQYSGDQLYKIFNTVRLLAFIALKEQ